eukprot:CAMPEP_0170150964 /NCGR_PEP_ID=MMETSP0033_2-20121228/48140_1 /TAXON_ID=195969 /ORGANISM="Dolichomastix tenuilepis, Strain CCMP3274" /LENGTH=237 /DNA_ID=CAMNT_0010388035 /DNA_START=119 /DNA_END=829 /DNA_ORIENTATION=-
MGACVSSSARYLVEDEKNISRSAKHTGGLLPGTETFISAYGMLRTNATFDALSDDALRQLLTGGFRLITKQSGSIVAKEGQMPDRYYVILDGQVSVTLKDGKEVSKLGRGASIGDATLLHGGARTATCRAASIVRLLAIDYGLIPKSTLQGSKQAKESTSGLLHSRTRSQSSTVTPSPQRSPAHPQQSPDLAVTARSNSESNSFVARKLQEKMQASPGAGGSSLHAGRLDERLTREG